MAQISCDKYKNTPFGTNSEKIINEGKINTVIKIFWTLKEIVLLFSLVWNNFLTVNNKHEGSLNLGII